MRIVLALVLALLAAPAFAIDPGEAFKDPAAEERARGLFRELRCMVCQNQSIDESDAPLAKDLRLLVREHLQRGETDAQIKAFLVARYGDFVLLKPPVSASTWLLWGAPAAVLVIGGAIALVAVRRKRGLAGPQPLSEDEKARVAALTRQDTPA